MGYRTQKCNCFWDFYVWVCRLWGILTAIGLWGVGVETAYRPHMLGIYLLVAALVVSFCECLFIINFWVTLLLRDEPHHQCVRVWGAMLCFDSWKKAIVYGVMAVPCFIQPKQVWLAIISGVMLLVCSTFYAIKTYKDRRDAVVNQELAKNQSSYDRFDEVQDDIEENLSGSMPGFQRVQTVADQEDIMDV